MRTRTTAITQRFADPEQTNPLVPHGDALLFQFIPSGSGGWKSNMKPCAAWSYDTNIVYDVCSWMCCVTVMSGLACVRGRPGVSACGAGGASSAEPAAASQLFTCFKVRFNLQPFHDAAPA